MDLSFENSQKMITSGKRRLSQFKTDDDIYEGSKQRQRLGGEDLTSNLSTHNSLTWNRDHTVESKTPLHQTSCGMTKHIDFEQSIIRGVELMDLQHHSSPLKWCYSNSIDADNLNDLKCSKYNNNNNNPNISSKENKSLRKLKKVYFRNRQEKIERKLFSPQLGTDPATNHSSNHILYMRQVDPGKDKQWDPYNADSLAHRDNISSAGTPPDANSFASFEDLGSQMTDEVFVKAGESRKKRDVTDEEREDRIVKWLCTVRNMTESHGMFNVRLS